MFLFEPINLKEDDVSETTDLSNDSEDWNIQPILCNIILLEQINISVNITKISLYKQAIKCPCRQTNID